MNQLRSECSLASLALCVGLFVSVSSCGSNDAPGASSGGSAGASAAGAGAAGTGGVSSAGMSGSSTGGASGGNTGGGGASSNGGASGSGGSAGSGGQAGPGECTPPVDVDAPVEKLSLTGCMNPSDPTKFADRVIPYEVNSPLWSDSADKQRGFVMPAGKTIHIKDCAVTPAECLDSAD